MHGTVRLAHRFLGDDAEGAVDGDPVAAPHYDPVDEGHVRPTQGGDHVVQLVLLSEELRRLNPLPPPQDTDTRIGEGQEEYCTQGIV